ncbi:cell division protein FtsA [Bacillaceae bacterium W0354]
MGEKMFALDIGTRSVVGIILEKNQNKFRVLDMISKEHEERSMLDGQIHNVVDVSNIIHEVKTELEKKHGTLTKVCVAAAGRALKTMRSSFEKSIEETPLISNEDIIHLELAAVQQAQYHLAEEGKENHSSDYYCVGYSVLHYYLDGQEIGSLIDQQGKSASVEIIATFLPKVVIESLLSALKRADLEMDALTLEPIAAIQVLIPTSMRRLNVALVDIGAGTSDIAITNDGTVTAYGMVPKAGDEITEALSQQFLLDFHQAEQAKRDLYDNDSIEFEDILGFKTQVDKIDVVKQIENTIEELAQSICDEILNLNGKAPQAVMLVGGGSLTPTLTTKIASFLQLPTNRVAVRGIDAIQLLENKNDLPISPEFVTPIGIAIAAKQNPVHYINVSVNNHTVRLFELKQLTVGDCLLAAGIQLNKLYGKPGMASIVYLNGKKITLPGTLGEAPTITLNGEKASIQDHITHNDFIEVTKGADGQTPVYTCYDVIGDVSPITVFLMDEKIELPPLIKVNNEEVSMNYVLKDGDQIEWKNAATISDLLKRSGLESLIYQDKPFEVIFNHEKVVLFEKIVSIKKNGTDAKSTDLIEENSQVTYKRNDSITIKELSKKLELPLKKKITVFYQNQPFELEKDQYTFYRNEQLADEHTLIYPNDYIKTKENSDQAFIFQDLFRLIDIDLKETKGKRFKLFKNGVEVGFVEQINDGDELTISWIETFKTN